MEGTMGVWGILKGKVWRIMKGSSWGTLRLPFFVLRARVQAGACHRRALVVLWFCCCFASELLLRSLPSARADAHGRLAGDPCGIWSVPCRSKWQWLGIAHGASSAARQ